jgi:pyruvate dehydrogenase E1 component alpha subunit
MVRIREFEASLDRLSMRGLIPGGVHTAIGQEAVAVGICAALGQDDVLACGHRAHHHTLARGISMNAAMAELFGKADGVSGGRGGTMHMSDLDIGLIGGNGVVGAGVGIAGGAALAFHMRGEPRVAVGIVGDGGANTGRTWEATNLAALWKLPLLIVCENNQYAVQTPVHAATAASSIADRAAGFGLPAVRVDGQNVAAVADAVRTARERALAGEGPTFIEAVTYRYVGHSTGEAQTYRPETEVEEWRTDRDAIGRLESSLIDAGRMVAGQLDEIVAVAKAEVAASVEYATASPWPSSEDSLRFVAGAGQPKEDWGRQDDS